MVGHFLKIQPIKEILEFQDLKRVYETYTKKKISNQKLINYQKFTRWTLSIRKQTSKRGKLHARIKWELEVEKCSLKRFSKYLEEGMCKIKQYLKCILMIINQNILATLLTFSNLQKNLYEKLYTKETTSKTTTTEFISKIPNRKIPNFQVMMAYQQNFMNIFQIN